MRDDIKLTDRQREKEEEEEEDREQGLFSTVFPLTIPDFLLFPLYFSVSEDLPDSGYTEDLFPGSLWS